MNGITSVAAAIPKVGLISLLVLIVSSHVSAQTVVGSVPIGSQPVGQIAVNSTTDRVYIAGGYAQKQLTVVNTSNPVNPVIVSTIGGAAGGAGVTVNPNTNRFYTSNGFLGQVLMYSGETNAMVGSTSIGACPGAFDIDVKTNLVYVTRQCAGGGPPLSVDPLFVLNGSDLVIIGNNLGSGGVVGHPRINSATGRAYVASSNVTRVFGSSPTFVLVTTLPGSILAVNPTTNRLYFHSGSNLEVRDGNDHSLVATIAGAAGQVAINTSLNRLYVVPDPATRMLKVIDGGTNSIVGSLSLGAGIVPLQVAVDSTKNRVYVAGLSAGLTRLYVVQDAVPGGQVSSSPSTGDAVRLEYRFKPGEVLRYSLSFRYDIEDYLPSQNPQPTRGSINQSFVVRQEVQSVDPGAGWARLRLAVEEVKFHGGDEAQAFDSTNDEHRKHVKTRPDWMPWGALLSSRGAVRLRSQGKVDFWRLEEVDKAYDEAIQEVVKRVIGQIVDHGFLFLPGDQLAQGGSWEGLIPLKFVGSVLSGHTTRLGVRFSLSSVEVINSERCARLKISPSGPPSLQVPEGSVRDAQIEFKVEKLDGDICFSLTRWNMVNSSVLIRTLFRMRLSGRLVNEHKMKLEVTVKRLPQ